MSVTQLFFNTAHEFDKSVDAIDGGLAEASVTTFSNCLSNNRTCPLARSTVSFSPVTAHTKVSIESVLV
eukprot:5596483-Pleurochrysis_carterae.AAC.5